MPTAGGGTVVEPRPIGIHPSGKYVYVGEHDQAMTGVFSIAVLPVDASYSLSFQSRITVTGNPSWISVDPQGRYLYVGFTGDNNIQVLGIDQSTGDLTDTAQVVSTGTGGGFLPSMTLVEPLQ